MEAALAACPLADASTPPDERGRGRAPCSRPTGRSGPLPGWVRLLANFPRDGVVRIEMHLAAEEKGTLDARLKAEIAWVAARNDRAWYALGHARRRLLDLGLGRGRDLRPGSAGRRRRARRTGRVALARKLTVNPALITDDDIAGLRKLYNDHEVAEVVFQVTEAAFFDRLTEASGLALEK